MIFSFDYLIRLLVYVLVYFFFCRFSITLIAFLKELKDDAFKQSSHLRSLHSQHYDNYVTNPSTSYKERNSKLEPERYYYKVSVLASLLLILFNSFILAQFLNQIGGLSTALTYDPIKITYGNLIAAVVVFVEILAGFIYHIAHEKQQEGEDTIWTAIKFGSLMSFLFLMFLEVVMWMSLSVLYNMSDNLFLDSNNFFRNFIDYFLAALGIGITLIEFFLGYLTSKYRKFSGDSSVVYGGRFIILSLGLLLILFIPSIALIFIGAIILVLIVFIRLFCLLGNYVFDKIKKNKSPSIS